MKFRSSDQLGCSFLCTKKTINTLCLQDCFWLQSQSTNTFGLPVIMAFWDALECLHTATLCWQPAPDLPFPFCWLSLLALKTKLFLLRFAHFFSPLLIVYFLQLFLSYLPIKDSQTKTWPKIFSDSSVFPHKKGKRVYTEIQTSACWK